MDGEKDPRILSNAEVKRIAGHATAGLHRVMWDAISTLTVQVQDRIRFSAVAAKLELTREARELSVKTLSSALNVPQYRIRLIGRMQPAGRPVGEDDDEE